MPDVFTGAEVLPIVDRAVVPAIEVVWREATVLDDKRGNRAVQLSHIVQLGRPSASDHATRRCARLAEAADVVSATGFPR
ncbi:hypothetical protein ACPZ19_38550 [Amycolatopsis lurida]